MENFYLITGGLTFLNAIWAFFLYPSNPTEAKYLTIEEKVLLIQKIQKSSTIEQKLIKKYQIIECFKDPVTWLFTTYAFTSMLHNNITFQSNILYTSLSIDRLGITIVNVVGGCFSMCFMAGGALILYKVKNSSIWAIVYSTIPGLAGSIAMITIPYEKKMALVAVLILVGHTLGVAFITSLGWATSSAGGYTKKFYRNISFMFAYSIANVIAPQLWKGNQKPRYNIAWSIQIVVSFFIPLIIAFVIHLKLRKRNIERFKYMEEHPEEAYGQVFTIDPSTGDETIKQVDIANLDLTDLENKFFIYPL